MAKKSAQKAAEPMGSGQNPFQGTDPQDTKAANQRHYTAGPAGPVPGHNPFTTQGVPVPAITAKVAKTLSGPQN